MTDSKPQPDFAPRSFEKVIETLRQALPLLEKLAVAGCSFDSEKSRSEFLLCNSCSKQQNCLELCDALKAMLPGIHQGRGHREHFSKLDADDLKSFRKVRFSDIFEQYQDCQHIFTHKQWVVLCLYYRDGKTEEQIAKLLRKGRTTVSDLLNRARRRKEKYDKKVRREMFEHLKKDE